jgi:serine/threonine protein kinase
MELCDNNLFKALKNKKANEGFKIDEIYYILNQLNNTFKIMFENNICHRDLKLQNILLKYTNEEKTKFIIKLTDYGISKHLLSLTNKLSTKMGTLNFIAPEILEGQSYDSKNDLWSLGIIIYFLYFHKYPYSGSTVQEILNQIKKGSYIQKTNDKNLDNLILKLLNPNPNERIDWKEYFNHSFFKNNVSELKGHSLNNLAEESTKSSSSSSTINNLKIIVCGPADTGKISFIKKWVKSPFSDNNKPTIVSENYFKLFIYKGNYYRIDLWHIAAQDRNIVLAKTFAKKSHGCIIMSNAAYPQTREE